MADSYTEYARRHSQYACMGSNKVTRALKKFGVTKETGGSRRFALRSLEQERAGFLKLYRAADFSELE